MAKHSWTDKYAPGTAGPEGGKILTDREYGGSARVTLEKLHDGVEAVTCGIYGFMVHTVYREAGAGQNARLRIEKEIQELIDADLDSDAFLRRIDKFCSDFN